MSAPSILTFLAGFLGLIVICRYLAPDFVRRQRILGALLVLALCVLSACSKQEFNERDSTSFLIRPVMEEGHAPTKEVLTQTMDVLRKRLEKLGVRQLRITPEGQNRILVQVSGLNADCIADVREQLKVMAKLEFRLVHPQNDQLVQAIKAGQAPIPPGYRLETEKSTRDGKEVEEPILIRSKVDFEGKYVERAFRTVDQQGEGVALQFTSEGGELFGKLTSAHVGERFAIILDGKIQSAPRIMSAIWGGRASITGHFTQKEAQDLASVLENPLSVPIVIEEERSPASAPKKN